jgi:hypothetical protein
MALILKHWRTVAATLFSLVLIAGVSGLARDLNAPQSAHASPESALLQAIATKDSDGDGLTDWEEALYGTDPHRTDSLNLGMRDGEAVARGLVVPKAIAAIDIATAPHTISVPGLDPSLPSPPTRGLTAAFAQHLYAAHRVAREAKAGQDLTPEEAAAIAQDAFRALSESVGPAPDFKTAKDIVVSGSGAEALRDYAERVEAVLKKNDTTTPKSELVYLQEVVEKSVDEPLMQIVAIAKSYRESAIGIAKLSVPEELSGEGLRLVNALARLGDITTNFAQVRVDPLATMLALAQYPGAILSLAETLIALNAVYTTAEVTFDPEAPGASFVHMIAHIAARQAAEKR